MEYSRASINKDNTSNIQVNVTFLAYVSFKTTTISTMATKW